MIVMILCWNQNTNSSLCCAINRKLMRLDIQMQLQPSRLNKRLFRRKYTTAFLKNLPFFLTDLWIMTSVSYCLSKNTHQIIFSRLLLECWTDNKEGGRDGGAAQDVKKNPEWAISSWQSVIDISFIHWSGHALLLVFSRKRPASRHLCCFKSHFTEMCLLMSYVLR